MTLHLAVALLLAGAEPAPLPGIPTPANGRVGSVLDAPRWREALARYRETKDPTLREHCLIMLERVLLTDPDGLTGSGGGILSAWDRRSHGMQSPTALAAELLADQGDLDRAVPLALREAITSTDSHWRTVLFLGIMNGGVFGGAATSLHAVDEAWRDRVDARLHGLVYLAGGYLCTLWPSERLEDALVSLRDVAWYARLHAQDTAFWQVDWRTGEFTVDGARYRTEPPSFRTEFDLYIPLVDWCRAQGAALRPAREGELGAWRTSLTDRLWILELPADRPLALSALRLEVGPRRGNPPCQPMELPARLLNRSHRTLRVPRPDQGGNLRVRYERPPRTTLARPLPDSSYPPGAPPDLVELAPGQSHVFRVEMDAPYPLALLSGDYGAWLEYDPAAPGAEWDAERFAPGAVLRSNRAAIVVNATGEPVEEAVLAEWLQTWPGLVAPGTSSPRATWEVCPALLASWLVSPAGAGVLRRLPVEAGQAAASIADSPTWDRSAAALLSVALDALLPEPTLTGDTVADDPVAANRRALAGSIGSSPGHSPRDRLEPSSRMMAALPWYGETVRRAAQGNWGEVLDMPEWARAAMRHDGYRDRAERLRCRALTELGRTAEATELARGLMHYRAEALLRLGLREAQVTPGVPPLPPRGTRFACIAELRTARQHKRALELQGGPSHHGGLLAEGRAALTAAHGNSLAAPGTAVGRRAWTP